MPGPLAMVTVTVDVLEVTTLPDESSTETFSAVPNACPAVPVVGVWLIASLAAAEALTAILLEVALVSEPSVTFSVYVPAAVSAILLNVATPLTAATDVVLPLPNVPGPLAMATVTVEVFDVMTLPKVSSTDTLRAVPNACPAVPVVGVCVITSLL